MKLFDKSKTQKLIKKIESGHFDYDDVENILMKLRDYSGSNQIFREIADFVAHKRERNKGIIKDSIEYMLYAIRYFKEYRFSKRNLDFFKPFPVWIKKLLIHQIEKTNEEILSVRYGFKKQQLTNYIKNHFVVNNHTVTLIDEKYTMKKYVVLKYLLNFISIYPTFTQAQIIESIIKTIDDNGLQIDKNKFIENQNLIILNLIFLLHCTEYKHNKTSIGYSVIQYDKNTDNKIYVGGHFDLDEKTHIVHKIITTELDANDYFDSKILTHPELNNSGIIELPQNIDISSSNVIVLTELSN